MRIHCCLIISSIVIGEHAPPCQSILRTSKKKNRETENHSDGTYIQILLYSFVFMISLMENVQPNDSLSQVPRYKHRPPLLPSGPSKTSHRYRRPFTSKPSSHHYLIDQRLLHVP